MEILWDYFFWVSIGAATIRIATPILYAALGEIIAEDAGFLNIGIEGMMTMGAWGGFMGAYFFGGVWASVLTAAVIGFLIGLRHHNIPPYPAIGHVLIDGRLVVACSCHCHSVLIEAFLRGLVALNIHQAGPSQLRHLDR